MRLLITSARYHPSVGGAEEVCRRLALDMTRRGHVVTVATGMHPDREEDVHDGVRVVSFDVRGNWALDMEGDVDGYQRFLMEGEFDVTFHYAAQVWTTDLVLPLLSALPAPAVLAPCGYPSLDDPRYARYFARLRKVLPGFAALVHHSDLCQDAWYAIDADLPRCFTIPRGTSAEEFEQAERGFRKVLGIDNRPLVLTVSNHTERKGHDLAVQAFQSVAPQGAVFAMIGNDSRDGCLARCRGSGDPRVLILENLPRELVVQALLESDVLLLTSEAEVAPLVILEAMTAGLPWVSTPVGNVRELTGGIVADPSRLSEKLALLLRNARLRQELGDRGRRWARIHARLPQIHERYADLLQRIVNGELRGAPVPVDLLAVDRDRIQGLQALAGGDWPSAIAHLTESLRRDPSQEGLRLDLLEAMIRADHETPLTEAYDIVQDQVELTPWHVEPNRLLFLLAGALGLELDLQAAEERAMAWRLPRDQLLELAHRGRKLSQRGNGAVQEALTSLM